MTIAKYSDMTSLATRLNEVSESLNDKCKSFTEYHPPTPHTLTHTTHTHTHLTHTHTHSRISPAIL